MARPMTVAVVALLVAATGCTSGDEATDTTTTSTVPDPPSTVATSSTTTSTTQPTTTSSTTTTTLPEPPRLEVLDPTHGATVTTARYTFTGLTDPGCTVTVGGRYEATVEEDGTWSLDLMLEPGRNSTTFTATHPETGLETSEAIRVYYAEAVELRGDGLGAVSFGEDETTTMDILTGLLGPPISESTCVDEDYCTGVGYGWCYYIRTADWQGLRVVIADCEGPDEQPYTPTLIGWDGRGRSTLRTPEGVDLGSTLGELQAVYGDRLTVSYGEGCVYEELSFHITEPHGPGTGRLYGDLVIPSDLDPPEDYDGSSQDLIRLLDPSTRVNWFGAGVGQSC